MYLRKTKNGYTQHIISQELEFYAFSFILPLYSHWVPFVFTVICICASSPHSHAHPGSAPAFLLLEASRIVVFF